MMRIEFLSTSPDRAGRYTVKFSDGNTLRLYRQTVEDFALYNGQEFSEKEFLALQTAASRMSAKMRAVRTVAASSVSKAELERRLIFKGEDPDHAKEAVSWMQEMHLVDDLETARQIVSRCISKGYGKARAKQALYEKRIPKAYWDEVLEDYPDQTDCIEEFLKNKLGMSRDEKDVRKAIDALLRRGFTYGQVRQALNNLDLADAMEE
jgi:regulatory protein